MAAACTVIKKHTKGKKKERKNAGYRGGTQPQEDQAHF